MGYQALLFCPDEKLARVVSQVFSELDFSIEPVHEPFASVKKLMAQRYDAIVVDCENEQNASLLFKSARNSSFNQSSLAIALVEGQAGVAKAYRIGANLVLTKPINVEQAKGTLRVARGLLRKNSDAAAASATSAASAVPAKTAPLPASTPFQPASRGAAAIAPPRSHAAVPEFEAPLQAAIPAAPPAIAASARVDEKPAVVPARAAQKPITIAAEPAAEAVQSAELVLVKNDAARNEAARISAATAPAQSPASAFTSAPGSAAAPAPAKEVAAPPVRENRIVESEPAKISRDHASHDISGNDIALSAAASSPIAMDAPSFAALDEGGSSGSGGKKLILIAFVVVVLAAIGYLGYGRLGNSSATPALQSASAPKISAQPAPALAPTSPAVAAPSSSTTDSAALANPSATPKPATTVPTGKTAAGAGNAPVIQIAGSPEPTARKAEPAPIQVKSPAATKTQAQAEESAPALPNPMSVASDNDSKLSNLISASPNPSRPTLATLKISQGVSQGLLIKRVQPKYPQAALAVHAQGAVLIEATINKDGNVINPKVLSGDPVLAHAAVDAVRQWRYKPYYLDGQPVDIQTQITINFKAN